MTDREFWSADRLFGLRLPGREQDRLLELCRRAGNVETGGILVGFYTDAHGCAVVTRVSVAPEDSVRRRFSFHRGTQGLQQWLDRLWKARRGYYLGEWHFHPGGAAVPSSVDIASMNRFAGSPSLHCPEPVLIIIGGDPTADWTIGAFVFRAGNTHFALTPV